MIRLSSQSCKTQTAKEFDFRSAHWPAEFHHTGPFVDESIRAKIDFPWNELTGEPLIYASMGTLQNGLVDVFREIGAATANYKNRQLVLSIGNHIDKERIGSLPKNAIVVKNAPQLELIKRASLCITHAGCNTVLESLIYGVPQIAIPIAHDQPGVARRIVENGTGRYMPLENLTAKGLATLIDEVLSNAAYLESVRKLQKSIAQRTACQQQPICLRKLSASAAPWKGRLLGPEQILQSWQSYLSYLMARDARLDALRPLLVLVLRKTVLRPEVERICRKLWPGEFSSARGEWNPILGF